MALFSRIFQGKKNNRTPQPTFSPKEQKKGWTPPQFDKSQVRLVIFQDHDLNGRKLIFDSKSVRRISDVQMTVTENKKKSIFCRNLINSPSIEQSGNSNSQKSSQKYCEDRPGSDTKMLGEMMFGSVAMSYKGSTLKVHHIRSPHQLMVTRVFMPTKCNRDTGDGESLDISFQSSMESSMPKKIAVSGGSNTNIAHSVPVDVPTPPRRESLIIETDDSGLSASVNSSGSSLVTPLPSPGSSSSLNSNSYNSMTRRYVRSQSTSLEISIKKRQSDEGVFEPMPAKKRPPKIGIGIIFNLPEEDEENYRVFQNFFFSHITLIESHVIRLSTLVEKAFVNKHGWKPKVIEAMDLFRNSVYDLYTAPRLSEPVWLNMMCYTTHRVPLCQQFLKELMTSVEKYDTKGTKFFISTLITAVLTHHLAWVPTVTPAGATPSRAYLDKHSAKWIDALAKSHPYNALWAQLGDMYGAIGFPLRLSRTVVTGRKGDIVCKILYILSYFIRCSEVHENIEKRDSADFEDIDCLVDLNGQKEMSPIKEDPMSRKNSQNNMLDNSCNCLNEAGKDSSTYCHQCQMSLSSSTSIEDTYMSRSGSTIVSAGGHSVGTIFSGISFHQDSPLSSHDNVNAGEIGSGHCDFITGPHRGSHRRRRITEEDIDFQEEDSNDKEKKNETLEYTRSISESAKMCNDITTDIHELSHADERNGQCDEAQHELLNSAVNCKNSEENVKSADSANVSETSRKLKKPSLLFVVGSPNDTIRFPEEINDVIKENKECSDSHCEGVCNVAHTVIPQDEKVLKVRLVGKEASCVQGLESPELLKSKENHRKPEFLAPLDFTQSEEDPVGDKCRLSPQEIKEEVSIQKIRHVGRTAMVEERQISPEPDLVDREKRLSKIQENDYESSPAETRENERKSNQTEDHIVAYQDSGVFEYSGDGSGEDRRESKSLLLDSLECLGAVIAPSAGSKSDKKVETKQQNVIFSRSNSMFNEYFEDDKEVLLPLNTELQTKAAFFKDIISFKRQGTIEGDESMFDEYINDPSIPIMSSNTEDSEYFDSGMMDEYFVGVPLPDQTTMDSLFQKSTESLKNGLPRSDSIGEKEGVRLNRQNSTQSTGNPVRCRSVTPTELGRRRHASAVSNASIDLENFDPFQNLEDVPLPSSDVVQDPSNQSFDRNFGRSLLAGYSDHYLSDFVLHGTNDVNFQTKLHTDLTMSVQSTVLDEPIAEAACIVADTDKWSVRLNTCQYHDSDRLKSQEMTTSQLVLNIIESVHDLWKLKMSPEFCLMHLEDRLQEIYFKSKMLSEYLKCQNKIDFKHLSETLGFDQSDLPLLLAVAGTQTSQFSLGLVS